MRVREAEVLQAAAVAVAAPRYMGAFAYAIGINLVARWHWFSTVEIISGLAMALLEGWAVAFIGRRIAGAKAGPVRWMQPLLLAMLPISVLPYLVGMNLDTATTGIMPIWLIWPWEFVIAAISPLIAYTVGYVDVNVTSPVTSQPAKQQTKPAAKPAAKPGRAARVNQLRSEGLTKPQIAAELGVSVSTVDRALRNGNGNGH